MMKHSSFESLPKTGTSRSLSMKALRKWLSVSVSVKKVIKKNKNQQETPVVDRQYAWEKVQDDNWMMDEPCTEPQLSGIVVFVDTSRPDPFADETITIDSSLEFFGHVEM